VTQEAQVVPILSDTPAVLLAPWITCHCMAAQGRKDWQQMRGARGESDKQQQYFHPAHLPLPSGLLQMCTVLARSARSTQQVATKLFPWVPVGWSDHLVPAVQAGSRRIAAVWQAHAAPLALTCP
jgi:hypothetical protein